MQQFACRRGEDADGEVGDAEQLFGLGDEREGDLPGVRGRGGVATIRCRASSGMGCGVSARFERRARISSKTCSGAGRRPVSTVCTRCGGKSLWITEPVGHTSTQCPQPIQRSVRTASIPFPSVLRTMIPAGHTCTHFPQAMQLLFSIRRVITSMSAEGFVGGDGLSERCQPAAAMPATGRRWPDADRRDASGA